MSFEQFMLARFEIAEILDDNIEAGGGILDFHPGNRSFGDDAVYDSMDFLVSCRKDFDIEGFIMDKFTPQRISYDEFMNECKFNFQGFEIEFALFN